MQGACRRAAAGPSSRGEPGRGRRAARDTAIDINGVTRRAQQLCPGPPGPIAGRGPPGPLSGPPGPISGPSLRPVGRAGRSRGGPAQAPSRRLRGLSFAGRWRLRTFFSVGGAVQAGGVSLAASPAARSHRPEARPSAPGSHPRRRPVRRTCGAALCRCFEANSGSGHSCTAASSWPRPGRPRSPGRRPVHGPGRPGPGRRAGPAYPCRRQSASPAPREACCPADSDLAPPVRGPVSGLRRRGSESVRRYYDRLQARTDIAGAGRCKESHRPH